MQAGLESAVWGVLCGAESSPFICSHSSLASCQTSKLRFQGSLPASEHLPPIKSWVCAQMWTRWQWSSSDWRRGGDLRGAVGISSQPCSATGPGAHLRKGLSWVWVRASPSTSCPEVPLSLEFASFPWRRAGKTNEVKAALLQVAFQKIQHQALVLFLKSVKMLENLLKSSFVEDLSTSPWSFQIL